MSLSPLPPAPLLADLASQYGTPYWLYDADVIRRQIASLRSFDVIRYAQKANSNTHILRLMRSEGVLVDAVARGEIERALVAGYALDADPSQIVFTADVLDRPTLQRVVELKLPVNVGSPQMLSQVGERSPGHPVWIRVNPGFGSGHSRKTNTGGEHSKHGIWHAALADTFKLLDQYRLELVGLHMHIGSGVDYEHLQRLSETMAGLIQKHKRDVRAISAGGGLSIPYTEGAPSVDTAHYYEVWDAARRRIESVLGHTVQLEIEPGRYLVAQSGWLVSELRAQKQVGANHFILVDAGFNELMRPAMYGAQHRISIVRPDGTPREGKLRPTVVAGPLCESGDVFTQNEHGEVASHMLPTAEVGDLVLFHDAGAYGASMSSNYNTRPLACEVLLDGASTRLIRRRQTVQELIALELGR